MNFEKGGQSDTNGSEQPEEEPANSRSTKEGKKVFESNALIRSVIEQGEKVGEGESGIVFQVKLDESVREVEEESGENNFNQDSKAVKLLKVFESKGKGRREYELQNKVATLIDTAEVTPTAKIPRGYQYENTHLSQEEKSYLNRLTDQSYSDDEAELFIMDFIEGDEIFERLMKEVVHYAYSDISKDEVEELTREELKRRAEPKVGFQEQELSMKSLGQKGQDDFRDFTKKMYKFLKSKGLEIKEEVLEQIENTTTIFSNNNLQHNDLHERNIMIDGPLFENNNSNDQTQVYIIDFGEMKELSQKDSIGMDDGVVLRRLRKHFSHKQDTNEQLKDKFQRIKENISSRSRYKRLLEKQEKILANTPKGEGRGHIRQLEREFQKWNVDGQQMKIFMSGLYDVVQTNENNKGAVIRFIKKQKEEANEPWKEKLLSDFVNFFKVI